MKEPTNKAELLQMMADGRIALTTLIAQIPQERMLEPDVEAVWSIKDILAHLTSWELEMCQVIVMAQAGQPPVNWPTTDEEVDEIMRSEGGRDALYKQTILAGGVNDEIT